MFMHVWLLLLLPSALVGVLCAVFLRQKKWAVYVAGGLPWFGLLFALLYTVYLAPGHDGGDGFWIIAQVVGGSVGAFTGVTAFRVTRDFFQRQAGNNDV